MVDKDLVRETKEKSNFSAYLQETGIEGKAAKGKRIQRKSEREIWRAYGNEIE